MGSDRARASYDPLQQYRSVVMQQGRVTLEADLNEAQTIINEEIRKEALDIVGPLGTTDNGYLVTPATNFDFTVGSGTMYVSGIRAFLPAPVQYSTQQEWLDHSDDPDWVDITSTNFNPQVEFIYLLLREQEVGAVEDLDLKDVALGGPDTAQRTHILQHFVRVNEDGQDCASGLFAAIQKWRTEGLFLQSPGMRLASRARLQVSFIPTGAPPDPCQPVAQGGYLLGDNQFIRIQISGFDSQTNNPKFLWGFDDASFLYRVDVVDPQTLHLQSRPVDAFHQPLSGQTVEVLRTAAQLPNAQFIASLSGIADTLAAPYNPDTQAITLPQALPAEYQDPAQTPQVFLRVWEQEVTFTPGTPAPLNSPALGPTGVQVTLGAPERGTFHIGDYWYFAVRPSTPQQVYPERYLKASQPPEGPRIWVCPLGVIQWNQGVGTLIADCRVHFSPLATPALHVTNMSWLNNANIGFNQFFSQGLQIALDASPASTSVTSSTMIVGVEAPPSAGGDLAKVVSQTYIMLAEPTVSSNVINWMPPSLLQQLLAQTPPGRLRVRVTLKGHFIWSNRVGPTLYLDGQVFEQSDGTLLLPSGNGARASDFESWFWLLFGGISVSPPNLDFSTQNVGTTSAAQTVTVTNNGSAAVAVSISMTGANPGDFAQTSNCTTIQAGQNCTINVTFTPQAAGPRNATLSISADGADPQVFTAALTGTGVQPVIFQVSGGFIGTLSQSGAFQQIAQLNDTNPVGIKGVISPAIQVTFTGALLAVETVIPGQSFEVISTTDVSGFGSISLGSAPNSFVWVFQGANALAAGIYTVTLRGTGPNVIASMQPGVALTADVQFLFRVLPPS